MLVPGVQKPYRSNSAFYNSQEHLQSVVNGLDQRNNYLIEGIDNNVENLTGIIPPPDAIATVDVSTTNYDPEYGRAGSLRVAERWDEDGDGNYQTEREEKAGVHASEVSAIFGDEWMKERAQTAPAKMETDPEYEFSEAHSRESRNPPQTAAAGPSAKSHSSQLVDTQPGGPA